MILGSRFGSIAMLLGCTLALAQGPPSDVIDALLEMPAPGPSWQPRSMIEAPQAAADEPPPNDATLEQLFLYWARFARDRRPPIPSRQSRERLLQACEEDPEKLPAVHRLLPETPGAYDRVKALLDRAEPIDKDNRFYRAREWLMFRSKHYRNKLLQAARHPNTGDDLIWGHAELEALANLDWQTARPILRTHAEGPRPRISAIAISLFYAHALQKGDARATAEHRSALQKIVGDRQQPGRARDFALDSLMESEWAGRDEWYLSLFADPTLRDLRDGDLVMSPLSGPVAWDPDKWIPAIAKLVGHANHVIHDAAVDVLVGFHLERARADALRPLLPWLMDKDWSSARDRLRLIQSMDVLDMPESVPGLIHLVETGDGYSSERAYAAESLARYRDPRANPALRIALTQETGEQHRIQIIGALFACGGVGPVETSAAVEALASELSTPGGRERIEQSDAWEAKPLPVELSIGKYLMRIPPSDDRLAEAALARAREIEQTRAAVAKRMLDIAHAWPLESVHRDIVRRIADGTASAQSIARALERREELQQALQGELSDLISAGGSAAAIASVLLAKRPAQLDVLAREDAEAIRALLASARLVREPLPLEDVGRLLGSRSRNLRAAAEQYLISEDSAEARAIVLGLHPGEALILGARQGFDPGHNTYPQFDQWEQRLRDEVRAPDGPDEIVALLTAGYWGQRGQVVVRRSADKASIGLGGDSGSHRPLTPAEWDDLVSFLEDEHIDDLPPSAAYIFDGIQYEYVRVDRDGGRRVFMNNPARGTVYGRLVERLSKLGGGMAR